MSFEKSPQFTQSTDEFFLTASNQIVKDLRKPPPASKKPKIVAGLET